LDLHLTSAEASAEEISAIDEKLKAFALGEHNRKFPEGQGNSPGASLPRHLLLPLLHAIQERIGWISSGALNYASGRLGIAPADAYGVASFYGMFSLSVRPRIVTHVCDDIACLARGAGELCAELETKLGHPGSPCLDGRATWLRSECLGLCERAPAVLVTAAGEMPSEQIGAPADFELVESLLRHAVNGRPASSHPARSAAPPSVPQAGEPGLHLLRRVGQVDPESLDDYRRFGGYEGLRRALEMGPETVIREVIQSRLVGRGGAAFPTGKKWEAVHLQRDLRKTHYVVCNADESEPGTFKDRIVMECDPFAIIEGMTIAGLAVGAQRGYIYVRGEYPLAAKRLAHAIEAARSQGLLGDNVLGRGMRFDIELRRGAGAYICGEETALFNSIEGYRGEPRNKPPFPTQAGLFRQPTVVNNVETLINIPEIILKGGAAYASIGTPNSAGYRLFCLSGHVVRPGLYELPFGATLRQVIDLAGGVGGNGRLQAILLGGAAGAFVTPQEIDVPLTFEATRGIGVTLGSGVVMLFDDSVDLRQILLRIAAFFRHESCGQCVPCRVGAVRQEEALRRLVEGGPNGSVESELAAVREMAQAMRDASICGLGQTASSALESALRRWTLFS
jgi:NADH-quinone oxidoreductase subunit F